MFFLRAITVAEMGSLKKILCFVLVGVFGWAFNSPQAKEHQAVTLRLSASISTSSLPESGKDSRITAFDVSPDGSLLAVLYRTWPSRTNFGLSVAIWETQSKRAIRSTSLGVSGSIVASSLSIDDEVIFAGDNKYLVVLGLGRVWILDASTCTVVRSIGSPRSEVWPPVRVLMAGRSTVAVTYKQGNDHFHVVLFDIPSAKMIGDWPSSAAPQSFSPDGTLTVAPDTEHHNKGGIENLLIINANTGVEIKSIPLGFGFRKWESGDQTGSFTARFLDDGQVVVTPDNMTDHSGYHSGNSIEVIDIKSGELVREIVPKNFGPTGELAVSPDLRYFGAYSNYVSARAKLEDGLWPNFHKPELLLFAKSETQPQLVISNLSGDGAVAYLRNMILPKISDNASVVAIAQHGTVKVFETRG